MIRILIVIVASTSALLATASTGRAQSFAGVEPGRRAPSRSDMFRDPYASTQTNAPPQAGQFGTHIDYDSYLANRGQHQATPVQFTTPKDIFPTTDAYPVSRFETWQLLPEGMVYDTYLAGTQQPRFALHMIDINEDHFHFEGFLGARVPLLRYGTTDPLRPEGFQIDAEGVAHVRIDLSDEWVVDASDFRGGLTASYGYGRHRSRFGYYHLSSHLQDEFMETNPGFPRVNFSRDVFVLGHSFYLAENVNIYAEAGYAFISDVSEPWEFQFGLDYAPCGPTGFHGAPFFAINGHLRQEVNFGGALTTQLGWAWVGDTGKMLRAGLHYYNGESNEYSFFNFFEQQIGFGLWYDF